MLLLNKLPKKVTAKDKKESTGLLNDFDESVALLITCGHRDVWEYGISFFQTSLKMLKELQGIAAMTVAEGIAMLFSKDKSKNKSKK